MNDLSMIWDEVVSMMDLELNTIQLQNWIMPLNPISLEGNILLLDAKSTFIRNMVSKKYLDSLEKCISYICKQTVKIQMTDPSQPDYYLLIHKTKVGEGGQISLNSEAGGKESSDSQNNPPSSLNKEEGPQEEMTRSVRQAIERKNRKLQGQREKNGYATLNPKYTMSSFVRGRSNDFAYATATAVINNPGTVYNPLFIYGASGLGKTHLMQAIAHSILENDPEKTVLYITSENFMNEMIAMIENGTNKEKENFRRKYRSLDVLLIDDIQFIAGKKATMEEVFHTFNDLKEHNKQIVLSADKPPRELKNLEERLVTRFEGGMTADIEAPDFETRVAILQHKMKEESFQLPDYVLEYIANNVSLNIRELEGALLKVLAYYRYKARDRDPATMSKDENMLLCREALKLKKNERVEISIEEIIEKVSLSYNIRPGDILSSSRQSSIAFPRQVAMYLARELTDLSFVAIGNAFSRDHSTVIFAVDRVKKKMEKDEELRERVDSLTSQLKNP